MTEIRGRTAFITGGASGLGLSMAKAFVARGGSVMLADIDSDGLAAAAATLTESGGDVGTVECNVADVEAVQAAAKATVDRFGKVHIVANNAGVSMTGKAGKTEITNWRWVIDINILGVVHGIEVFVPILREQGEGGHVINTASIAGHLAQRRAAPYNTTKFAVVGYSEALKGDLAEDGIGVSVLCPGFVKTNIMESELSRPSLALTPDEARQTPRFQRMRSLIEGGLDADEVGRWVADCVEADRFYIFTHPDFLQYVEARHAEIISDYRAIIEDGRFGRE